MFNPSEEQIETLQSIYGKHANSWKGIQYICDELINMLSTSPTHRVVEAPEGYEFGLQRQVDWVRPSGAEEPQRIEIALKPIPKPCPPPVLEPVTVTVESVYGVVPTIPEGYEAKFGRVDVLGTAGYGAAIKFDFQSTIADINLFPRDQYAIGLRKWEPR